MLNTRDSMREGTNKRTYTTTKHITTLLLRSRVKTGYIYVTFLTDTTKGYGLNISTYYFFLKLS